MPEGLVPDPLAAGVAAAEALDRDRRLAALEQRPQVAAPIALAPTPYIPGPQADWYANITNGAAFGSGNDDPWAALIPRVALPGLYASIPWITEAGTTGEVMLTAASGTKRAATVSLPAASSGIITYRWLHGLALWAPASYNVDIWARRSGGANNVRIGYPQIFLVGAPGCSLAGV